MEIGEEIINCFVDTIFLESAKYKNGEKLFLRFYFSNLMIYQQNSWQNSLLYKYPLKILINFYDIDYKQTFSDFS